MKTLTLLRHAKSGPGEQGLRDYDRPLNAKGRRAGQAVGQRMRGLGLEFDRVVASPAIRVVETLEEVAAGYGRTLAPDWDRRIYLASAATLLDLIGDLPDNASSVLLAGHNPGLEDLVLHLVPDRSDDRLREDVEEKFPTASVAELVFDLDRWGQVTRGTARLARFIRPRDLDPSLGPDPA